MAVLGVILVVLLTSLVSIGISERPKREKRVKNQSKKNKVRAKNIKNDNRSGLQVKKKIQFFIREISALKIFAVFFSVGIAMIFALTITGVNTRILYPIMIIMGLACFIYCLLNCSRLRVYFEQLPHLFKSNSYIWGMIVVVLIAIVFSSILSFKTFPIAEGWYSVYAKYINSGKVPYKDFELLFMPIYTYIIAGVTHIFGYEIYVLRIFGIIIFATIAAVSYAIYTQIFRVRFAAIAATLTVLFMQSEVVQIFYDYIRIFDLFAYCATLCLMLFVKALYNAPEKIRMFDYRMLLCGLFAAIAFLVRQSSGAFVIVFYILVLLFLSIHTLNRRQIVYGVLTYFTALTIPFILLWAFLSYNGALESCLNSTVFAALGAKGGVLTVLFAWIPRWCNNLTLVASKVIFAVCTLAMSYFIYLKYGSDSSSILKSRVLSVVFFTFMFAGIFVCYSFEGYAEAMVTLKIGGAPDISLFISLLVFVVSFIQMVKGKSIDDEGREWYLLVMILSGMAITLGYGCGTSGGLSEGQTALGIGLSMALMLKFSENRFGEICRLGMLILTIGIAMGIISFKYITPYSWWGLQEGDLREAKEWIDVKYASHILVSKETKKGIENVTKALQNYSTQTDSVFVFPQAPIFYLLADRYPTTMSIVQWFDVSNDDVIDKDIEKINEQLPAVIVHIRVPEFVVNSHESLFRGDHKSGLRKMSEALDKIVSINQYRHLATFNLQEYPVDVYYREQPNKAK